MSTDRTSPASRTAAIQADRRAADRLPVFRRAAGSWFGVLARGAIACSVVPCASGAAGAAECSLPQKNRAAILKAIERASSCADAREILQACASSTSGDVAMSDAVVAKCERLFKSQLSPVDRSEYERQLKACTRKHGGERGTESVSLVARCKAGIAADFAK